LFHQFVLSPALFSTPVRRTGAVRAEAVALPQDGAAGTRPPLSESRCQTAKVKVTLSLAIAQSKGFKYFSFLPRSLTFLVDSPFPHRHKE